MKIEVDTIDSIKHLDDKIENSINGTCFSYSWFLKLKKVTKIIKISNEKGELVAFMPLFLNEKGDKICQSTMYIPYGGPILLTLPRECRNRIRVVREVENILSNYLKNNFSDFSFSVDDSIIDVMPFIRNNIIPEIRYTYKIDLFNSLEQIYLGFGKDRKKEIKRCKKNKIDFYLDKDLKYFSCDKCVEWEKKYNFPSSVEYVEKYIKKSIDKDKGMAFVAKKNNEIYGGVYVAWDKKTAYILYSYFDRCKEKNIGVIAFLYYNIFEFLKFEKNVKYIDFEGSVYESVENFNISFGAYQSRYYNLHYSKTNKENIIKNMYNYYEK